MRSFKLLLLAGSSSLAILAAGAGTARADWGGAGWEAGVEVDGTTRTSYSHPTDSPADPLVGPTAASGADGDDSHDGGSGNGSAGIHASGANTSVSVTSGTVSGGVAGNGGNGGSGSGNGGHGADSAGILVSGDNVRVGIGSGASVNGGTAGDGGRAGTNGGSASGGGAAMGVSVFGRNATIVNDGTISAGTGGFNPATGARNGGSGISLGNQDIRTSTGTTLTNNGTINGGIDYYTTDNSITNNGTVHGWVSGDGAASATITNNGTIRNAGNTAVDFWSATQDNSIVNNGTILGDIQLGVVTDSDHLVYLNAGSRVEGDILARESNNGNVVVGASGPGVVELKGNIGSPSAAIHSLTIAGGATLAFESDSDIYSHGVTLFTNSAVDLRTSKVVWHEVASSEENIGQTFILKTTINANTGKHGYWVFDFLPGDTTMLSSGVPVITPTVVGTVTSGARYVVIQDLTGRTAVNMPSVVNGAGYRWTVSSVTGTGQTDTDGVSYGTGATNIVLTAASQNAAGAAGGVSGAGVRALATYGGNDSGLLALSHAVNNLTAEAEIRKAGAQLRPESTGNTAQASMGAVTQALGTIQTRTDSVRMAAGDLGTGIASGETPLGLGLWGQGFGSLASQGRRADTDGYDADTYGLALGGDVQVLDPLRLGLSFAFARTNVNATGDRVGSGQDIDSYITTLYGSYAGRGWYLDGALTWGLHKYDSTRTVAISGATAQRMTASFDGQQWGARAEAGLPWAVGPTATVTPLLSLAYNTLKQEAYSEAGGAAALAVGSSSTDSIRSGLGAKASTRIATVGNWEIRPNARLVWLHEFNGSAPEQTSGFVAGGTAFTTPGSDIAADHAVLGVGLDVASVRNTTLGAKYDADLADRYVSHTASLQLRTEF